MTPDEWEDGPWLFFGDPGLNQKITSFATYKSDGAGGWELIDTRSIEHPSVVGYFDHLYAQELGIAYP